MLKSWQHSKNLEDLMYQNPGEKARFFLTSKKKEKNLLKTISISNKRSELDMDLGSVSKKDLLIYNRKASLDSKFLYPGFLASEKNFEITVNLKKRYPSIHLCCCRLHGHLM